jgi:hypothetical protein
VESEIILIIFTVKLYLIIFTVAGLYLNTGEKLNNIL